MQPPESPDPSPPPDPAPHPPTPPPPPSSASTPAPILPPEPPIDPTTGHRADSRPGQPTKLTEAVAAQIVAVVRAGNYLTVAAQHTGIGISTLQTWLARGRAADAALERGETLPATEERYRAFLAAVSQAEVHAEVIAATAWRSRVTEDWRAARDFLRYRVPDRWRAVTTVNIRPEEAEQRIEAAVTEALAALGIETPSPGGTDTDDDGNAGLLADLADDRADELAEDAAEEDDDT